METMYFFMDTHDKKDGTFPNEIGTKEFEEFYKAYETACKEEGVISVKIHAGLKEGRAFCLNMAPNEEAVYRVHQKIGLLYSEITKISTISPADLLYKQI